MKGDRHKLNSFIENNLNVVRLRRNLNANNVTKNRKRKKNVADWNGWNTKNACKQLKLRQTLMHARSLIRP